MMGGKWAGGGGYYGMFCPRFSYGYFDWLIILEIIIFCLLFLSLPPFLALPLSYQVKKNIICTLPVLGQVMLLRP